MMKTSIIDKLNIIFELTKTSNIFIAVIAFLLFIVVVAITNNKRNESTTKKIYLCIYAFIILAILITYYSSFGKMFDYLMNNLFIAIYFPNLAIYLIALIVVNVIFLVSVFKKDISKVIKNINVIVFAIMNYLLALILNIIHTHKLDVFTQTSVYGNKEAQALIELSSTIFLIWVFFLLIYKMIMMYQRKMNPIDAYRVEKVIVEKRKRILPSNIREIRATEVVHLGTRERILPENIKEIRSPKYVKSLPTEVKQQRILPNNIREIKPLELVKLETKQVEEKPIAKRILPTNIREVKSPKFVKELPKIKEEKQVIKTEEKEIVPVVEEKPIVKPIRRTNSSLQELDLLLSASYDNYTIDDYKALKEMLMKKKAANQQRITRNNIEAKKYQQLKEIYESAN